MTYAQKYLQDAAGDMEPHCVAIIEALTDEQFMSVLAASWLLPGVSLIGIDCDIGRTDHTIDEIDRVRDALWNKTGNRIQTNAEGANAVIYSGVRIQEWGPTHDLIALDMGDFRILLSAGTISDPH